MIQHTVRRLMVFELLILIAVSPFLLFPTPQRTLALLVLPLLAFMRWIAHRRFFPPTPLNGSLVLLLAMVTVSIWATFDIFFSLPKITGVLLGIAFYFALAELGSEGRPIWLAPFLLILTGSAVAGVSLIGTQWSDKFPALSRITDNLPLVLNNLPGMTDEGFNPNSVAGALLFVIPLLVALMWVILQGYLPLQRLRRIPVQIGVLSTLLLTAGTLILTQSRSGYVALLVGIGALPILPHRRITMITFIAATVTLIAVVAMPRTLVVEGIMKVPTGANAYYSFQQRVQIWQRAILVIEDFPYTGIGMGTFRRVVPVVYPLSQDPQMDIGHPHNHLLAAGVDLGVLGMVAYLALWVGAVNMAITSWRSTSDMLYKATILGIAAGLFAHFTWGMTEANVLGSKVGILFWFALGTLAAFHRRTSGILLADPTPDAELQPPVVP
jgi:putative inorganic carbon (HCO3(-)) transporter